MRNNVKTVLKSFNYFGYKNTSKKIINLLIQNDQNNVIIIKRF